MVRIRAFKYVLGLPLVLVVLGLGISLFGRPQAFELGGGSFLAGLALQAFLGLSLACPICGKSPYAIGPHLGPFSFVGKPWPERVCSKCGHHFF
jgi:hypothetical protein